MPLLIQHVLVTLVTLAAVVLVVRRIVGTVRPAPGAPPCSTCAAGMGAHARRHPASIIRHPASGSRPPAVQDTEAGNAIRGPAAGGDGN